MSKKYLFRFMCELEFKEYLNGRTLKNTTQHKAQTNSIGFCFLDYKKYKPEEAIHFLSGLVDTDVCAVFEVDENDVNESYGIYADSLTVRELSILDIIREITLGLTPTFKTKEYCTTEYNREKFKLVKYCDNIPGIFTSERFSRKDWEWKDESSI